MSKEPFLQISKRRNGMKWQERLGVRFIALILSLIVCGAVIVALVKMNPVDVYRAIWDGAMGTERRMWMTIRDTMVLLCIAIGLAPAFKMKFWNIGAEGQILIGGACSAAVMIYAGDKMSPVLLLIVMLIASILGGMIWGMIPSVFKAYWNTNETLFTLMLNYVAMQVVTYCIVFWENPKGSNTVGIINQATQTGWLPQLFGQKYGWNVVIVLILTVGMFVYLKYHSDAQLCGNAGCYILYRILGESERIQYRWYYQSGNPDRMASAAVRAEIWMECCDRADPYSRNVCLS